MISLYIPCNKLFKIVVPPDLANLSYSDYFLKKKFIPYSIFNNSHYIAGGGDIGGYGNNGNEYFAKLDLSSVINKMSEYLSNGYIISEDSELLSFNDSFDKTFLSYDSAKQYFYSKFHGFNAYLFKYVDTFEDAYHIGNTKYVFLYRTYYRLRLTLSMRGSYCNFSIHELAPVKLLIEAHLYKKLNCCKGVA